MNNRKPHLAAALIILVSALSPMGAQASNEVFGAAELREIAGPLSQGACEAGCETQNWSIRPETVPAATAARLLPDETVFLVTGKGPNSCGSGRCTLAYVLRSGDDLIAIWDEAASTRVAPLQADEVPAQGLRAALPRLSLVGLEAATASPLTLPDVLQSIDDRYARAQTLQGTDRKAELVAVKALLDTVAADYPESNAALNLALGDNVGQIDPAALDAELASLDGAEPAVEAAPQALLDPTIQTFGKCFAQPDLPAVAAENPARIRVQVDLDGTGAILGMPTLLDPATPDANARKLFQRALIALDDCVALQSLYLPSAFEVTLTSARIEAASPLPGSEPAPAADATPPENPALAEEERQPLWALTDSDTEKSLNLQRADIARIQARLILLGFDPKGIDGVLGRGARSAISTWQASRGIPPSGYVDQRQLEKLEDESKGAFTDWIGNPANLKKLEEAANPPPKAARRARSSLPPGWFRDSRGMYCRPTILGLFCKPTKP